MRAANIGLTALVSLLTAAACADVPTAPSTRILTGKASPSQDYVLDPVIVIGQPQKCDPYTDPDWCEGADSGDDPICMTSVATGPLDSGYTPVSPDSGYTTSSGCTNTGSGGPGGDSGGSADPAPSPEPEGERSLVNDLERDTIPPDCTAADLNQWQELYCFRRMPPDSAQTRATLQALDQIAERGEECAAIAQKGRELLSSGQITFFVWKDGDGGGYGHRNTGIQLDEAFARLYGTPGSYFERTLVHEIEHFLGFLGHVDPAELETPHSVQCS